MEPAITLTKGQQWTNLSPLGNVRNRRILRLLPRSGRVTVITFSGKDPTDFDVARNWTIAEATEALSKAINTGIQNNEPDPANTTACLQCTEILGNEPNLTRVRLKLEIDSSNDAFQDGFEQQELARILRVAAQRIEIGWTSGDLFDINGNKAGHWSL